MFRASLRLYAELNDFLPPQRRQVRFLHAYPGRSSIKDVVESLGVPHPEIGLLLVGGQSVGFDYVVQDGDRISVYPYFSSLEIAVLSKVMPPPLVPPRFIADVHLGKTRPAACAFWGSMCCTAPDSRDEDLAACSSQENRILLTRDRALLKRSQVVYGYCVRSSDPRQQLFEVLHRYRAMDSIHPFQRCLCCNHPIEPVSKGEIGDRLPPFVRAKHTDFRRCPGCDRIYWKGTHYQHMQKVCEDLLSAFERKGSDP